MHRAILAIAVAASAAAAERRTVALYDVQRTPKAPIIDGRLGDEAWADRPAIHPMVLRDAATRAYARVQSRTIIVYDDEALYVGVHMDEPHPKTLKASSREYDGRLWWDDSVELYIEPGHTHGAYYKFVSNSLGTRADWRGLDTPEGFKLLDWGAGTSWTAAAHVGKDFWSLELRFPWSDFGVEPPQAGAVWSFEVVRFRYAHDPNDKSKGRKREYSSWNVGAGHRAPHRFGNLVFGGATRALEGLLADRLAPVCGPSVRIYGARGELLYTQYPELLRLRTLDATAALAAVTQRLNGVRKSLDPETRSGLDTRHTELTARLAALRAGEPGAAAADGIARLLGEIEALDWSTRYRELNAKLGAPK